MIKHFMKPKNPFTEQKMPPVIDTRTVRSSLASTQDKNVQAVTDDLKNPPADIPPAGNERDRERENLPTYNTSQDALVLRTQSSSSRIKIEYSPPSNPPHNSPPNNVPSHSPAPNGAIQPQVIFDTSPHQTINPQGASSAPVSNKHSFNTKTINHDQRDFSQKFTYYNITNYNLSPITGNLSPGVGPTIFREAREHGTGGTISNEENDKYCRSASASPLQPVVTELDELDMQRFNRNNPGTTRFKVQKPTDTARKTWSILPNSFRDKSRRNATSLMTSTSRPKPLPDKYAQTVFSGSILSRFTKSPDVGPVALKPFLDGGLPILGKATLHGKVHAYMHANLDPSPGQSPRFHALWDPSMGHQFFDGPLPSVYSMNVYDVGYFDSSGKFWLLFNLLLTQERNEELLKFKFKTFSFSPLPPGASGSTPVFQAPQERFLVFRDENVNSTYEYDSKSKSYVHKFVIHKGSETAAAIVLPKHKWKHCRAGLPITTDPQYEEYFATQSIEWYRHAKQERNCRDLRNGELVLITECYKATTWGFLSYYPSEKSPSSEKRLTNSQPASFYTGEDGLYHWEYSPYIKGLEAEKYPMVKPETEQPADDGQCIGFRAFSIRCDRRVWKSTFTLR